MNYENVTLCKLALASTMYDSLAPFNNSPAFLNSTTGGSIDLTNTNRDRNDSPQRYNHLQTGRSQDIRHYFLFANGHNVHAVANGVLLQGSNHASGNFNTPI